MTFVKVIRPMPLMQYDIACWINKEERERFAYSAKGTSGCPGLTRYPRT